MAAERDSKGRFVKGHTKKVAARQENPPTLKRSCVLFCVSTPLNISMTLS